MRIYNAKNSQIDLPLAGNMRLTIGAHSVSGDFMPSDYFLTLVASTFEETEIALIVSGPFEINMCAKNPAVSSMVVQSLDEAIARFNTKKVEEEVKPEPVLEEPVVEPEIAEPVVEEVVEEPKEEQPVVVKVKNTRKKNKKG